ncbi:hypothetical protein IP70_18275 [alpha proteobacterium AAP38]|nr:hypothetical protein IP70_18275 [alpha proteobacterium AAP38]
MSGMRLRWRLVIAFLSVSVLPVLTASYIAADIISGAFASNMERWLQEAAMLFAERSVEDEVEARQAVSIVASSLRESTDNLDRGQIDLSAHLLTSVGYQTVAIYDADGRVLFANGPIGDVGCQTVRKQGKELVRLRRQPLGRNHGQHGRQHAGPGGGGLCRDGGQGGLA